MKKFINIGRIITFSITLLSTIPLFINYIKGVDPKKPFIVQVHVWVGLLFFIFAILSMVMQRRQQKKMTATE